jgi:putative CocE/NonD family hydrolase
MSVMGLESHYYPRDQRCTDYRADNLVFQSPQLSESLLVVGPVKCLLWASSDAVDTDFAVKLIEVGEDGLPINISQGIVRARYREGYDRPRLLEPGQPYLFEIVMLPVGIRFQKGSRIRFDVASSDFPAFDRNHNTGRDYWSDAELRVARQTIFHDRHHPSRVVLPVLHA